MLTLQTAEGHNRHSIPVRLLMQSTIPSPKLGGARMKKGLRHIALLLAMLLSLPSVSVFAQETTATINGQIADSTGAAVAGAEVTLTNLATKDARTVKSNDEGYYSITFIQPGTYDMSVKMQGFKEFINQRIEMQV